MLLKLAQPRRPRRRDGPLAFVALLVELPITSHEATVFLSGEF
jgi:hypothetical protein